MYSEGICFHNIFLTQEDLFQGAFMLEALCFGAGASCVKHGLSQFLHVLFCG